MKYLCLAYVEELQRSGRLLVTHALQSVRSATTVRVRHARVLAIDGPFAETKETLGGFFLIEVRPIEESLREESRYGGVAEA